MLAMLAWFLVSLLMGWIAFPITYHFFPKLADRGFTAAKALGLLLSGWVFWLFACGQILPNSTSGVLIAVLIVVGISSLCLRRIGTRNLVIWCKSHWKLILISEAVFLIGFLSIAFLRSMNPEIANTEKPMELAFINSILRSPSFPPADPWLSGYSISYYYFGYVLISVMIRLTGISSSIGYNLASATWFALSALGAFGIIFNLISRAQKNPKRSLLAGLLGPLFVLIVSNLEGLLEVLFARGYFWKADETGALRSKFWTWLDIVDLNQAPVQAVSWMPQRWMWWWRASRVVTQYDLLGNHKEVIDEFPFFSYLLSDLHPHVLAMPFVLLTIAFAIQFYFHWLEDGVKDFHLLKWIKKPSFWLSALVFGSLGFLNTWDLPFYLAFISVLFALAKYKEIGRFWARLWDFFRIFLLILAAGFVLYTPFYVSFQSQAGGILPSMEFFTRGIQFWVMFGALLLPICAWLIWQAWIKRKQGSFRNGLFFTLSLVIGLFGVSWFLGWMLSSAKEWGDKLLSSESNIFNLLGEKLQISGMNFSAIHGNVDKHTLLLESFLARMRTPGSWILLGSIIFICWSLLSERRSDQLKTDTETVEKNPDARKGSHSIDGFVLVLILFGAALAIAPEFIYLQDQFGWPINTYFKFYFAAWIFWGLAAAYCFWSLSNHARKGWRVAGITLSIIFLAAGLIYPILSSYSKTDGFNTEKLTLDGLAYRREYYAEEEAGIEWLKKAPYGYIVEAIGGQYSEYARVATETGLPNILGWPGHENQWRGGVKEMGSREIDVRTLYESSLWEETKQILDFYQIRYIIVGALESNKYPALDEQKFLNNLKIGFQNAAITIYEYSEVKND